MAIELLTTKIATVERLIAFLPALSPSPGCRGPSQARDWPDKAAVCVPGEGYAGFRLRGTPDRGRTVSPSSTNWRIASERETSLVEAHFAIASIKRCGIRVLTNWSCPVAGRPRFFGATLIVDFDIINV
jgi:hypothetical protein